MKKNNAVMIVRDYGVGIEEQEKEKIFERYYKRDRKSKSSRNGIRIINYKRSVDLHSK